MKSVLTIYSCLVLLVLGSLTAYAQAGLLGRIDFPNSGAQE